MSERAFRKLSRSELLELLIEESKKNEELERQLEKAEEALASRRIKIDEAGSLAEAALALNGVFEAADAACTQYMENIRKFSVAQEQIHAEREAVSKMKAEQLVEAAKQKAAEMEADVMQRCEKIVELAGAAVARFRESVKQYLK